VSQYQSNKGRQATGEIGTKVLEQNKGSTGCEEGKISEA